jgi:hypothetical protein
MRFSPICAAINLLPAIESLSRKRSLNCFASSIHALHADHPNRKDEFTLN